MKIKLLIATLAALAPCVASAQTGKAVFYPTITTFDDVRPGEVIKIPINLDNTILPSSMQMSITLPDGFTVPQNDKKKYLIEYSDRIDSDVYSTVCGRSDTENKYTIIIYVNPEYNNEEREQWFIQPGDSWFLTIPVSIGESVPDGNYTLQMTNIKAVTRDVTLYTSPNANISVNVDMYTGVESVTQEKGATEYYSLQGVRVDNPRSGLYIKRTGSSAAIIFVDK